MMKKQKGVLPQLKDLREDAPAAKVVCISHLDNRTPYISSEKDILLIVEATDAFVKNEHTSAVFNRTFFYRHVRALLG